MSKDAKDAVAYALATLCIVLAVGAGIWIAGKTLGGIGNWWHSITSQTPEEEARSDAEAKASAEAWAKDPRNPKVAGQACLDAGGIPDYSSWDGDVKACNKPGGGNVEVKQSVEVKQ